MEKAEQIAAIGVNLAEGFISVRNKYFLDFIASFPEGEREAVEVNLLSGAVKPKKIDGFIMKQAVNVYKNWFFSELKKHDIKKEEIEKVLLEVSYKQGNLQRKNYICHVTINAFGKEFKEKVMAAYS
ncbi:hypothetical protein HZA99_03495 [Candidatus Woesearchaeota archaeon]|nr:hypothetical protein [Candidatus Woesearchaeota archaeon]